jgi:acyl-CoA reductase-like NAD-dependent aldehyde dehydrogenase
MQMREPLTSNETDYELLINGHAVAGDRQLAVEDPATGKVFATVACASAAQVEQAVAAAAAAFPAWAATTLDHRQALLRRIADIVDAELETLARLVTLEQGKPLADARMEVGAIGYFLRHYAAVHFPVRVIEDSAQKRIELHRHPLGVVAAIVPWNFPLLTACNKVGAALLTGNTVVLKPAATTPVATLKLGALIRDVLPPGVLNIVSDQNDLGSTLSGHPLVRKVSFTGSTVVGSKVMAAAAGTLKRITLELGGNDAGIVLDDCDPKTVAPRLFDAAFMNCGQVCIALKRLYVHDSQYDAICAELARLADECTVGPGVDGTHRLGPVQNRLQYDKLKAFIAEARDKGRVIAGGETMPGPGYFIRPTIVRDLPDDARLVSEEQFGPVLPVIRYHDLDDAIARANNTNYGLGNSVWSSNIERATAVASRLDSGTVWVNQHGDFGPDIPFAGAKMSGIGVEMSELGLHEFTQSRVISVAKQTAV